MRPLLALLILLTAPLRAQTPEHAASQTRLQKLELTYQDNLRKVQAPLLQQYLVELKALADKASPLEAATIQAEISQVQKLIVEGGAVDLLPAKPLASERKGKAPGIVFTLEPHEAKPPQVGDAAVPIGEASWTLSRLPAGNYDLIVHYACAELPAGGSIEFSFADQKHTREFKTNHITQSTDTFRVMRLGRLKIAADVVDQPLIIKSLAPGDPWLFIKQALLVKAQD